MSRFSIKDILLLILMIALAAGWYVSRQDLAESQHELGMLKDKYHFLDVEDPRKIAAVQLPMLLTQNSWQWRVHLPEKGRYWIRAAFRDLRPQRPPSSGLSGIDLHLEPGESVVSVALDKQDGVWKLHVGELAEEGSESGEDDEVDCESTQWIDKNYIGMISAGADGTEESHPEKKFVLMHLMDSTPGPNGRPRPWNDPADGVIVWIEKIKENEKAE